MLNDNPSTGRGPNSYHLIENGELQGTGGHFVRQAHQTFRDRILAPNFSCVAAKAAFNTDHYAFASYGELGSPEATAALARDLQRFCHDQDEMDSDFTTMVAVFRGPREMDELTFEARLWEQLRALHRADTSPYSPEVSADPSDPSFGFSFAGRAFFIIGGHPRSSRVARAFPDPALVFNAHRQFRALKGDGRWPRFQETIRGREMKLQGSLNPNLADHGQASEARQYSGRAVEPDWQARFPSRPNARRIPETGPDIARCPFLSTSRPFEQESAHD
ncbi:guanitoxin biosynthesis heme-dependent pre-guanitoxin N-hydroxylase GntA [Deinococcus radiopugnans]|uniref:YqcI/YcgG family protein n=1 Tax=Deinococcus radiopugnans ATCC 19172 TaxID=585398 RepID=A0A5C4XU86_9DEIO|nr:guanitoxin biosynthesis heme-dependent pre-guanitoxin N-hydroxylase GntA [Deinococcus radiopugnans]MBB6018656.1 hypothetical protein [Deinococcus radiopugnans ATCC 19172]TNM67029.1 YqcI/YcgG family protein [Deinococcus radiopugnans ATCC 19172]